MLRYRIVLGYLAQDDFAYTRIGCEAPAENGQAELEVAYQQTAGAIAGLYEFAPQEEVEAPEVAENGQAPELELAEA